jgi:hypothetical protein
MFLQLTLLVISLIMTGASLCFLSFLCTHKKLTFIKNLCTSAIFTLYPSTIILSGIAVINPTIF